MSENEHRCTGVLVNNTADDGRLLVLTAAHCIGNVEEWEFHFGYESGQCVEVEEKNKFVLKGARSLAEFPEADIRLIELTADTENGKEVHLIGWSMHPSASKSAFMIHHPLGKSKQLALEEDPISRSQFGGENDAEGPFWKVEEWDQQTSVEAGSSGAPLLSGEKMIGILSHGNGMQGCGNGAYCGALEYVWDELSIFLDPTASGQLAINEKVLSAGDASQEAWTELSNATLHPNPVGQEGLLQFEKVAEQIVLMDYHGSTIKQFKLAPSSRQLSLAVQDLRPQVYVLLIFYADGSVERKRMLKV